LVSNDIIEASFVTIERTVECRLLERGRMQPDDHPGTHSGVYREAVATRMFAEPIAADLADQTLPREFCRSFWCGRDVGLGEMKVRTDSLPPRTATGFKRGGSVRRSVLMRGDACER
jgi:hypothetical protein